MDPAPWRKVVSATIITNTAWLARVPGRVGGHHWVLTLECGHERTRQLTVPFGDDPVRLAELVTKAPKKAKCWRCRNREAELIVAFDAPSTA
jgi:hypothetical protein